MVFLLLWEFLLLEDSKDEDIVYNCLTQYKAEKCTEYKLSFCILQLCNCFLYLFNCIFSTFYDCSDHFSRWLRSSVVLSLPGLVFSVLFTLPNYFQLRTIIKTDVITKLDNKTHSQLIEVWLDLLLTVFASYFFQLLRDVYPFGRLNSSEKPNSYQFQEIEEDSKYYIQKQELTYLST